MKIIVYTGTFQYGVINKFIELLSKALQNNNVEVITIDINSQDYLNKLIEIFSHQTIDCVIGFGGIGAEIKIENESIYNIVNTNYLAIQVDHPVHHIGRLVLNIKNYMVACVDKSHVDYIDDIMKNHHTLKFFLPHGGISDSSKNISLINKDIKSKEIDILFSASYLGEPTKEWIDNQFFPVTLIDKIINLLLEDDYISIHEAFNTVLKNENISLSATTKLQATNLLASITWYVRRYKRLKVFKKLASSGLNITLCGKGWEHIADQYPNVEYKGELSIDETMVLMQKSKVALNVNPFFTKGGHERVFTAMLHNCVVFTDRSTYYEEYYTDNQDILYYSLNTIEQDITKLVKVLNDQELLDKISSNAFKITSENHLWKYRSKKILEMITLANTIKQ